MSNLAIAYHEAKECLQNFVNVVMNHKDEETDGINIITITDEQVEEWHNEGLVITHHDDDEAVFWIDGHLILIKIHYREIENGVGHEAFWKILD